MDLTKPISYNSLSINTASFSSGGHPASGYRVDEVNVGQIDVTAYLEKKALQDGMDASDVYLGGRHISAIITAFGSTPGDLWDKGQDLLAAFSPTLAASSDTTALGFIAFDFFQPTADIATWPASTYPNGIPMRYYARPAFPPTFSIRRDEQGGTAALGSSKQFRVSLIAKDPQKVNQAETTASITGSTSILNLGDYPSEPYVSISATSTTGVWAGKVNGSEFTVNIDGSRLTAAQAQSQNKWVVDTVHHVIWGPPTDGVAQGINLGTQYANLVPRWDRWVDGGQWGRLDPGSNTVDNAITGDTLNATMTIRYRDTWA